MRRLLLLLTPAPVLILALLAPAAERQIATLDELINHGGSGRWGAFSTLRGARSPAEKPPGAADRGIAPDYRPRRLEPHRALFLHVAGQVS